MKSNLKKIIFPFVGDSIGGSHISTIITIKNLDKSKFSYQVIIEKKGPLEDFLRKENINYTLLNIKKFSSFIKRFMILRKVKPDIVHTNDLRMHQSWTLLCFLNNIAHVWHQHTLYHSRINLFYLLFARRVISISKFCHNRLNNFVKKKTYILINPFETFKYENFNNSSKLKLKKKLGFKENEKIIIYIGDDNYQKRFDFFISIAEQIKKELNNIKFLVFLKSSKSKKVSNENFKFFVGNYKIKEFLKISDILISPSVNEGFGRVLVEAHLTKTLVVASDSGGHKEIIKNNFNGFLVKKDSKNLFLIKILYIIKNLNNKKIKTVIDNGFLQSKKKYSLNKYTKKLFSIYEKI